MRFSKKSECRSSVGVEILAYVCHCLTKIRPISDCFIPDSELKYEDLDNITTDCVDLFVFSLYQSKRQAFFWDTWYIHALKSSKDWVSSGVPIPLFNGSESTFEDNSTELFNRVAVK